MNLSRFALNNRPIVLAFVSVLFVVGLYNFSTMPRREDPVITIRDALVVTSWPGATATKVEELITDPLERVIAEISEVKTVESISRVGLSVIQVSAADSVTDTDQVWDEVRAKVGPLQHLLPSGAQMSVNSDFGDVYEIVFAISQTPVTGKTSIERNYGPRQLELFAELIEDEVGLIDSVAHVDFWGVQPERIYVEVDSADWAKINVTASQLKQIFEARNIVQPGGELDTTYSRFAINPTGEFTHVSQMNDLVVRRVEGNLPVRLGDLPIRIDRRYEEPPRTLTRLTRPGIAHQPSLILGISMKTGDNVVEMSQAVDRVIHRLREQRLPPDIELTRVNDLPRQVDSRILGFLTNLIQGVMIVLAIGLLVMGWRPALIMASAIPISMLCAFAIVPHFGVQLEQFAIASLIISLGMVVDNAIVVSDNAFRLIREGTPKIEAITRGTQELAIPILIATLTTIFAFMPMLTITGDVGEYIKSLPIVVSATLACSFFVAMLVTPIMCDWLLKVPPSQDTEKSENLSLRYERIIGWCLEHKGIVLGSVFGIFLFSLLLIPVIGSQFFPAGLRNQIFVKVWLPEGSPIAATSKVAEQVEQILVDLSPIEENGETTQRLSNVVTFIGTGGPRIMLTQEPEYDYPYYAFLLVNTTDSKYTADYAREIRLEIGKLHQARVTADLYMLGPPIRDPLAFRLSGPDSKILRHMAREMVLIFKQNPSTLTPYSNWGAPGYQVRVKIDPYAANLAGVSNADVALTIKTLLSGAHLTNYREGDHLVPVMLRTLREMRENLNDLSGIFVNGANGKVPLDSVAEVIPTLEPAVIARRNMLPTITVGSRIDENVLANNVAGQIKPQLEQMLETLPTGYFLENGGEQEETDKALVQVVRAVGIAMLLITLVLIIQYNSFLKPQIILLAVPLGLIGVAIGLLVTGWAMGFMAMLGALALAGIVINNAVILIDFIEKNVADGQSLRNAVTTAGQVRMRPIILTTLTTIGGLLPLSLFGGALWAPMTNGMIFGLIFSTGLTLIVVPTIYVLFVENFNMKIVK